MQTSTFGGFPEAPPAGRRTMSGELLASVLGALEAFWDAPAAPESEGEAVVWRNVALRPTAFDGAHPARAARAARTTRTARVRPC